MGPNGEGTSWSSSRGGALIFVIVKPVNQPEPGMATVARRPDLLRENISHLEATRNHLFASWASETKAFHSRPALLAKASRMPVAGIGEDQTRALIYLEINACCF
jgi:hypothetical protein